MKYLKKDTEATVLEDVKHIFNMADEISILVKQDTFGDEDKPLIFEKVTNIKLWASQIEQQINDSKDVNQKLRGNK